MERITFEGNFCDIARCREEPCKYPDGGCSQRQVWDRLKAFEDAEEQVKSHAWISVDDRLPEKEKVVLLSCTVLAFNVRYVCCGFYVPSGTMREDSDNNWDYECCEYNEEADDYEVKAGFYESICNWDDYSACEINDFVTHWKPLPQPPKENKR